MPIYGSIVYFGLKDDFPFFASIPFIRNAPQHLDAQLLWSTLGCMTIRRDKLMFLISRLRCDYNYI